MILSLGTWVTDPADDENTKTIEKRDIEETILSLDETKMNIPNDIKTEQDVELTRPEGRKTEEP